ncbi:hypothetical protein BURK1_01560 [Burkholderiales bacterium]|nr:hypothetical protein BURK1_01560 [Burkholderiales bacterium]
MNGAPVLGRTDRSLLLIFQIAAKSLGSGWIAQRPQRLRLQLRNLIGSEAVTSRNIVAREFLLAVQSEPQPQDLRLKWRKVVQQLVDYGCQLLVRRGRLRSEREHFPPKLVHALLGLSIRHLGNVFPCRAVRSHACPGIVLVSIRPSRSTIVRPTHARDLRKLRTGVRAHPFESIEHVGKPAAARVRARILAVTVETEGVRAGIEQRPAHVDMSACRCVDQECRAVRINLVRIIATKQQRMHGLRVSGNHRDLEAAMAPLRRTCQRLHHASRTGEGSEPTPRSRTSQDSAACPHPSRG